MTTRFYQMPNPIDGSPDLGTRLRAVPGCRTDHGDGFPDCKAVYWAKFCDDCAALLVAAIRAETLEEAARLVEAKRRQVLAIPDNGQWTEPYAELISELRASGRLRGAFPMTQRHGYPCPHDGDLVGAETSDAECKCTPLPTGNLAWGQPVRQARPKYEWRIAALGCTCNIVSRHGRPFGSPCEAHTFADLDSGLALLRGALVDSVERSQ